MMTTENANSDMDVVVDEEEGGNECQLEPSENIKDPKEIFTSRLLREQKKIHLKSPCNHVGSLLVREYCEKLSQKAQVSKNVIHFWKWKSRGTKIHIVSLCISSLSPAVFKAQTDIPYLSTQEKWKLCQDQFVKSLISLGVWPPELLLLIEENEESWLRPLLLVTLPMFVTYYKMTKSEDFKKTFEIEWNKALSSRELRASMRCIKSRFRGANTAYWQSVKEIMVPDTDFDYEAKINDFPFTVHRIPLKQFQEDWDSVSLSSDGTLICPYKTYVANPSAITFHDPQIDKKKAPKNKKSKQNSATSMISESSIGRSCSIDGNERIQESTVDNNTVVAAAADGDWSTVLLAELADKFQQLIQVENIDVRRRGFCMSIRLPLLSRKIFPAIQRFITKQSLDAKKKAKLNAYDRMYRMAVHHLMGPMAAFQLIPGDLQNLCRLDQRFIRPVVLASLATFGLFNYFLEHPSRTYEFFQDRDSKQWALDYDCVEHKPFRVHFQIVFSHYSLSYWMNLPFLVVPNSIEDYPRNFKSEHFKKPLHRISDEEFETIWTNGCLSNGVLSCSISEYHHIQIPQDIATCPEGAVTGTASAKLKKAVESVKKKEKTVRKTQERLVAAGVIEEGMNPPNFPPYASVPSHRTMNFMGIGVPMPNGVQSGSGAYNGIGTMGTPSPYQMSNGFISGNSTANSIGTPYSSFPVGAPSSFSGASNVARDVVSALSGSAFDTSTCSLSNTPGYGSSYGPGSAEYANTMTFNTPTQPVQSVSSFYGSKYPSSVYSEYEKLALSRQVNSSPSPILPSLESGRDGERRREDERHNRPRSDAVRRRSRSRSPGRQRSERERGDERRREGERTMERVPKREDEVDANIRRAEREEFIRKTREEHEKRQKDREERERVRKEEREKEEQKKREEDRRREDRRIMEEMIRREEMEKKSREREIEERKRAEEHNKRTERRRREEMELQERIHREQQELLAMQARKEEEVLRLQELERIRTVAEERVRELESIRLREEQERHAEMERRMRAEEEEARRRHEGRREVEMIERREVEMMQRREAEMMDRRGAERREAEMMQRREAEMIERRNAEMMQRRLIEEQQRLIAASVEERPIGHRRENKGEGRGRSREHKREERSYRQMEQRNERPPREMDHRRHERRERGQRSPLMHHRRGCSPLLISSEEHRLMELQGRNLERREAEMREMERREAEMRDNARRDAEMREIARRDAELREIDRREAELREREMMMIEMERRRQTEGGHRREYRGHRSHSRDYRKH